MKEVRFYRVEFEDASSIPYFPENVEESISGVEVTEWAFEMHYHPKIMQEQVYSNEGVPAKFQTEEIRRMMEFFRDQQELELWKADCINKVKNMRWGNYIDYEALSKSAIITGNTKDLPEVPFNPYTNEGTS